MVDPDSGNQSAESLGLWVMQPSIVSRLEQRVACIRWILQVGSSTKGRIPACHRRQPTADVDLQPPPAGCHSAVISRESRKKTWRRTWTPLTAEKRSAPLLSPSFAHCVITRWLTCLSIAFPLRVKHYAKRVCHSLLARFSVPFPPVRSSSPKETVCNTFRYCLRRNAINILDTFGKRQLENHVFSNSECLECFVCFTRFSGFFFTVPGDKRKLTKSESLFWICLHIDRI